MAEDGVLVYRESTSPMHWRSPVTWPLRPIADGLMTSEFLALRYKMPAREAIQATREWKPAAEKAYCLFVVACPTHPEPNRR
jgi:hypothetical protein